MFIAEFIEVEKQQRQINLYGWPVADIISALSFLVILITLYVSFRTAREAFRANALNSLPLLTLFYNFDKDEVYINNVGKGDAVKIRVDKFYNFWADKDFKLYGRSRLIFRSVNYLKHGESQILETTEKGVVNPLGLTKFTMFSTNQKPLTFAIKFSDLSGTRYITKIRIYKSKVEITSAPKPYNIWNKFKLLGMRLTERATLTYYFIKVNFNRINDSRSG